MMEKLCPRFEVFVNKPSGTEKRGVPGWDPPFAPDGSLLHAVLVGLDHLLDHLAADRTGLTAGKVAVVALLEVDTHLP